MTKRVWILLGGFFGPDGWATSAGMYALGATLKPDVASVEYFTWDRYQAAADDMKKHPDTDLRIGVGFSGGGSRFTWLNRDNPNLRIDLMVLYDPSPEWQMVKINDSVKKAVVYQNRTPFFFGLGGGALKGPNVTVQPIAIQHMFVQSSSTLHQETAKLVRDLG